MLLNILQCTEQLPTTKTYLIQYVNSTENEKPWSRKASAGTSDSAWCGPSSPSRPDQATCGGYRFPRATGERKPQSTLLKSPPAMCLPTSHQTKQATWLEFIWEGLQIFTIYPHPGFSYLKLKAARAQSVNGRGRGCGVGRSTGPPGSLPEFNQSSEEKPWAGRAPLPERREKFPKAERKPFLSD